MRYEWDKGKAALNRRKHGVDFPDAIAALEDPHRLEDIDPGVEHGEERIRIVGTTAGIVLSIVVTLRDEDRCRIISARKATRDEEDRYYAGDREAW
ncbi:MAG: BrnT family toxin [Alphaproteobacteria bacterium]|nr:BrnT family toxin [Alphaproteobacteria bacterium]